MSIPKPPKPAKLVISVFMKDKNLLGPVTAELTRVLGAVDIISRWFSFDFTTYYEPEMGAPLFRRVLTFQTHIEQNKLADIKILTNQIEQRHTAIGRRRINLDPGYMVHERFVLATGKNYAHRIYIGSGIYADLTLLYRNGNFEVLSWTYPDYSHHQLISFLEKVRKKYVVDVKQGCGG
jgi:hypothetical protein